MPSSNLRTRDNRHKSFFPHRSFLPWAGLFASFFVLFLLSSMLQAPLHHFITSHNPVLGTHLTGMQIV
jgi:hypothetical protein